MRFGIDRISGEDRPRHQHGPAYATVVLSGFFEQAGYFGRFRLGPGDVLVQPTLDAHADRMISKGLEIIRLPWAFDSTRGGVFQGCDVERVRAVAERDGREASALLRSMLLEIPAAAPLTEHEADYLAQSFGAPNNEPILVSAGSLGISREALSRQFRRIYGVSPARYRSELRARAAWRACLSGRDRLAHLASELGYADQAHMTRDLRRLTGSTPNEWRRWAEMLR